VLRAALLRLRLDAGSPSSRKIAENANSRIQMNARRVPGQRIGEITQQQINDWLRTGTPARDFEHLWIVVADLTILARNAGMVQEYPPPSDKNWRKRWVALHGAARKTPDVPRASTSGPSRRRSARFHLLSGRSLAFDEVNVGLQMLVGTLGASFGREDVHSTQLVGRWSAPAELLNYATKYAEKNGFYPGETARLNRLHVVTYSVDGISERHRLRLEMARTTFFDMLATNGALGPFTSEEAPLLDGRSGIEKTRLSNLVQIELVLITSDGYTPIFKRAAQMAFLGGSWQVSSGETLQIPFDLDSDGCPDVFRTAVRGLGEEVGISPDMVVDLAVTALVATPEFATIGVLMRGSINCTAAELASRLNRDILRARDNWEHTGNDLISIENASQLAGALTDRKWTKQSAAAIIFAHAEQVDGNIDPISRSITAAGGLKLEGGSGIRGIVPQGMRDELVQKYVVS